MAAPAAMDLLYATFLRLAAAPVGLKPLVMLSTPPSSTSWEHSFCETPVASAAVPAPMLTAPVPIGSLPAHHSSQNVNVTCMGNSVG